MSVELLCTLTLRCNNDCVSCFIPRRVRQEGAAFSRRQLLNHLGQIALPPGGSVVLTGGEPTTHAELPRIVRDLKRALHLRVTVVSNAERAAEMSYAKSLKGNVDEIVTNVYDTRSYVHDQITNRPESLQRKLRGLDNLSTVGIPLSLKVLPLASTYRHLPSTLESLLERGVTPRRIIIKTLDLKGSAASNFRYVGVMLSAVSPFLDRLIEVAGKASVATEINFPLCLLSDSARAAAEIRPRQRKRTVLLSPNHGTSVHWDRGTHRSSHCQECSHRDRCTWFSESYIDHFGDSELVPIEQRGDEATQWT